MELTRRKFLQTAVFGAAGAAVGLSLANLGLGPFNLKKVEADQEGTQWSLQITNLAGNTVSYPYNQLLAMPVTSETAFLYCEGDMVAAGNWSGVSLGYLLQRGGLDPAVANVNLNASDGYEVSIPLSVALNPNVIIANDLDGSPLPEVLRLVLPGENGALWIARITSITMSSGLANATQYGGAPTNSTTSTSTTSTYSTTSTTTQQQEPVQPQFQPAKPNNETSTEPAVIPANVTQSVQKASATQEPSPGGSGFPVLVGRAIALGATLALMAAGYLSWAHRHTPKGNERI